MIRGRLKGFIFLFPIAYIHAEHPQGSPTHPANKTPDAIHIERLSSGSNALAERIAGMLLCTQQNAPGGKDPSTLEWYFASSLSSWNNEVLEKLKSAKEINFDKAEFSKKLEGAFLKRLKQKEIPKELLSISDTLVDAIADYTNNIFIHSKKLSQYSTQSMARFEKDLDKKIRTEISKAHTYSKNNKIDCNGTEKKTGFWAHYSFIPNDEELSTAEKRAEDEADRHLAQAAAQKKSVDSSNKETPTGNEKLEKDIEDSLDYRNLNYKAEGKRSAEKSVIATVYYVPDEKDYSSEKDCTILGKNGRTLAQVNCAFKKELAIQGTGILSDGRTVNYSSKNRYMVTPHKYGLGSSSNPLVPFRSLAIDLNYWRRQGYDIKDGDRIYIKSTDGMKIPGTSEVHNGIWEISDRGGKIKGNRIDLFFGTMSWRKALVYLKDPNNFATRNDATAQMENVGSKKKTLSMNFLL